MIGKKKITIYDVANQAGVSRQTVSRVLNNRPDVARETRERIQDVIQRLGHQPSQIARSLSQGTSCTLGVVGYGIEYYGPSRTLSVIEKQANEHGYSLTLSLTHEPEDIDIAAFLNTLVSQHVDGIIWAVPQIGDNRDKLLDAITNITTPVVCANMLPHPAYSLVDSNNYNGGIFATQHLIERGYQRIGIITGPSNWIASSQRYEGWKAAHHAANIRVNENLIVEGDWSAASGYEGSMLLLASNPDIDAIFACNDQMALGALRAASKLGRKVPEDLALVGYDNIPESEYFSSPLTTVRQNFSEQGKRIVEEIERRIRERREGIEDIPTTEFMNPELIIRESSGATPEYKIGL
jgi:LacI family transcriptional regulator